MRDALSMFDRIASFAGGQITYEHALESLNVLDYSYFIRTFDDLLTGDYRSLLLLLDELLGKGFEGQTILAGLAAFARDLLVVQHPGTSVLLEKPERVTQAYEALAARCTPAQLFAAIRALVQADQQYRQATNKRLLIELTLLGLVSTFHTTGELAAPAPSTAPAGQTQAGATAQTASPPQASTAPAPSPAPTAQPTPTAQPSSPTPTSSTPAPVAEPTVPQPQPVVTPEPVAPPQPAPTPQPVANASSSEQAAGARRQLFGRRRGSSSDTADSEGGTASPAEEEHEPFTEEELQRAYVRFVEQELSSEQIICRNILHAELPTLQTEGQAELALPPGNAIRETVEAVLPQLQSFLRRTLHNTLLVLSLREKSTEEQSRLALTPEDRLKKLIEINPDVQQLKEQLQLRLS